MDRDGLTTVPEAAPQATAPARGVRRGSFRALGSTPFRLYFADQASLPAVRSSSRIGSIFSGWIISAGGPRVALLLVPDRAGLRLALLPTYTHHPTRTRP
jgi:hypothetical protein